MIYQSILLRRLIN